MARKDVTLINSLVSYVNDIKPYHTKFREFVSEILLTDSFNVSIKEDNQTSTYLQNIWTRDSVGGYVLTNMSDGSDGDRIFLIPPAIYPRFTLNDSMGQTPVGDDPATQDLTDLNGNGIPDSEEPWIGSPTASHQTGKDEVVVFVKHISDPVIQSVQLVGSDLNVTYSIDVRIDNSDAITYGYDQSQLNVIVNNLITTDYTVNGNQIMINGLSRTIHLSPEELQLIADQQMVTEASFVNLDLRYNSDKLDIIYLSTGRYKVPFHQGSRVRVDGIKQVFGVDYVIDQTRSFIQFLPSSKPTRTSNIDINLFRSDRIFISYNLPFDDGTTRLYDRSPYDSKSYGYSFDYFLITVDQTQLNGCRIDVYNADQSTAEFKAKLKVLDINGTVPDGTVYTITAVEPWRFRVQRTFPSIGPIAYADFKIEYVDSEISFIIDRSWTSYQIEQDENSYFSFNLLSFGTDIASSSDASEFFSNLSISKEHGFVDDLLHHPVKYKTLGTVKRNLKQTLIGEQEYYTFELDTPPPRWTYVELRIDQEGQYNQWVGTSIHEEIKFTDLIKLEDGICTNSIAYRGQFCKVDLSDPNRTVVSALPTTAIVNRELDFYPINPLVSWINLSYDDIIYDIKLFNPVCNNLSVRDFYDEHLYDTYPKDTNSSLFDVRGLYSCIIDDMYFTMYFQDTGNVKTVHNVVLHPDSNLYQEPIDVHELVVYREGAPITKATVLFDGIPFDPFALLIEDNRVVVTLSSPLSIMIELA